MDTFPQVRTHDSLLSLQQSQSSTGWMPNIECLLADLGGTNYIKQERERKRKHMVRHGRWGGGGGREGGRDGRRGWKPYIPEAGSVNPAYLCVCGYKL